MLRRARYRPAFIAPFGFLLMTCVRTPAPVENFHGNAAIAAENTATPSPAATAPELAVAASNPPPAPSRTAVWPERLDLVRVYYANTEEETPIRLYASDGTVDENELAAFRRVVAAKGAGPAPIDARLVQLVVKAAYHFHAHSLVVVSAYRPVSGSAARVRRAGKHATGEAIDFKLRGVDAKKLASYVRTFPRAGVGIYTHPDTQYVHLDVRDESFHWLDASPPGKSWHEKRLDDPQREDRDAAYTPETDLPEKAAEAD